MLPEEYFLSPKTRKFYEIIRPQGLPLGPLVSAQSNTNLDGRVLIQINRFRTKTSSLSVPLFFSGGRSFTDQFSFTRLHAPLSGRRFSVTRQIGWSADTQKDLCRGYRQRLSFLFLRGCDGGCLIFNKR